jgi:hypothetical protein
VSSITTPGALLSTLATLLLVRKRRLTALLTAIGASSIAAMVAIRARFKEPVNKEIVTGQATALPADWESRRDQWEYAHATSAVIHGVGLSALIAGALRDTETD